MQIFSSGGALSFIVKNEKTFFQELGYPIHNVSQLRLFNILNDLSRNEKFVNVWKCYIINEKVLENPAFFEEFEVGDDDWWDLVAYMYYNSPMLWWIICMVNKITNPFETMGPGVLKVIRADYLYQIIREVEKIAEL